MPDFTLRTLIKSWIKNYEQDREGKIWYVKGVLILWMSSLSKITVQRQAFRSCSSTITSAFLNYWYIFLPYYIAFEVNFEY